MALIWIPKPNLAEGAREDMAKIQSMPDVQIPFDVDLPVVITNNWEMESYVKGYHVYRSFWTPIIDEILETRRQPENQMDKYAVCVLKDARVVGHLKKGSNGRFAKTIFYFLRSDAHAKCSVRITGEPVNLGDKEGMQVPCVLQFEGQSRFIELLKQNL